MQSADTQARLVHRLEQWLNVLLFLSFFAAWALFSCASREGATQSAAASFILALQLFVVQIGPKELMEYSVTLPIFGVLRDETMLYLGVGCAGLATSRIFLVFWPAISNWLYAIWFQILPPKVLFLGGGACAAKMIEQMSVKRRAKIWCIDASSECQVARALKKKELRSKVRFVQGLANDIEVLKWIQAHRVAKVWILCGSDELNFEIHRQLKKLREGKKKSAKEPRWLIEIDNRQLTKHLDNQTSSGQGDAPLNLEAFSLDRLVAQHVLKETRKPVMAPYFSPDPPKARLHVAVVGQSPLAQALIMHLISQFIVSPDPACCIQISWLGSGTEKALEEMKRSCPAIDLAPEHHTLGDLIPIAKIQAFECEDTPSPQAWVQATSLLKMPLSAVYVACKDDWMSQASANRCLQLAQAYPQSVRRNSNGNLGEGLVVECKWEMKNQEQNPTGSRQIDCWEGLKFDSNSGEYPGSLHDDKASSYFLSYDSDSKKRKSDFINEPQWSKWSSRESVSYAESLNSLGLDDTFWEESLIDLGGEGVKYERYQHLEHRRYCVERALNGWLAPAPGTGKTIEELKKLKGLYIHDALRRGKTIAKRWAKMMEIMR